MDRESNVIKEGDYVIIRRLNFAKLHKISKAKYLAMLGRDEIDLTPVIGESFWSTFKLELKGEVNSTGSGRVYSLKKCKREISFTDDIRRDVSSGPDNREINDDGSSQRLSTAEIVNLRVSGMSGQEIVTQLVENSTTFLNKTEYSQEKYLKKKEKKYFEYVTVRKPTLRLIMEVVLRQPSKTLGMRMDTLAQITAFANVQANGLYILYETGCSGVVGAAMLNRLDNDGRIIHVHCGINDHPSVPVMALNLPKKKLSRLMSVNIHRLCGKECEPEIELDPESESEPEPSGSSCVTDPMYYDVGQKRKANVEHLVEVVKKKRRLVTEQKVNEILAKNKAHALVICGREHPANIFNQLVKYLGNPRPFVIYNPLREPLQEMFRELKNRNDVVAIRITESIIRMYQVLPERTHPEVNTSGTGGYLLSGIFVGK